MNAHFPPERRILTSADYRRVFQQGKRNRDQALIVLYWLNQQENTRLGLAISKKYARRAIDRNRIKRLIRESFRRCVLPQVDVVVMCRAPILAWSNRQILSALEQHWSWINNVCATSLSS